ncbi:MAG: restriction endonuclease subunit S [Verrucomicrobiales bacterium]|nr:restriction endonuclease subunit S [Verrucomicrobiales bacterium]
MTRLATFAERNSILISRSNTPPLVGACAYVPKDFQDAFLPDTLWLLRPNDVTTVCMRWLSFVLLSSPYRLSLQRIASGTSESMKKIQKGAFLKLKIAVPPLPEQRKIAEILTTWDEALEKLDALIAAQERRKKSLMQQLFTGKTRLKGFDQSSGRTHGDKFGIYPIDWKRIQLGEVTREVFERNTGGADFPVLSCTKHHGLVLSQNYFGKRVHAEDTSSYRMVRRGEFAYATNHIEEGSIGFQDVCDAGLVSPIYTVFRTVDGVNDRYLFRLLKSTLLIHHYRINTSASVDRRGSLRYQEFAQISVWMPQKPEQIAIAKFFDIVDQTLALLRNQRSSLEQQKRGLMQKLLTGKLRTIQYKNDQPR